MQQQRTLAIIISNMGKYSLKPFILQPPKWVDRDAIKEMVFKLRIEAESLIKKQALKKMKAITKPRGFVPMSKNEREQFNKQKIRRLEVKLRLIQKEIDELNKH